MPYTQSEGEAQKTYSSMKLNPTPATQPTKTHELRLDLWPVALSDEFALSFSIFTACISNLKPFMKSLESGVLWAGSGPVSHGHDMDYGKRSTSRSRKYSPSSYFSAKHSRS